MRAGARDILSGFICASLMFLTACGEGGQRKPTNTYIPDGYVGWVRIEYGIPGAPPLPHDWRLTPPMRWQREMIPAAGLLQTSTNYGSGFNSNHGFYFYSGDSIRPASEGRLSSSCGFDFHNASFSDPESDDKEFVTFFVGPPETAQKYCQEMAKYRYNEWPYYRLNSMADLPVVGNLNDAAAR